ncbi:MAG: hypothetical protein GX891_03935 [Clostridiales bacterium]|nr:hypothetical protein [Clostridiales bacterium]
MRDLLEIVKLQLKNNFRIGKKEGSAKYYPIIAGVGLLPIFVIICMAVYNLAIACAVSGVVAELFVLLIASAQVFELFFVSRFFITTLLNADDNEFLAMLPVSSAKLFAAKFTVIYLGELAFSSLMMIPMMLTAAITLISIGYPLGLAFWFALPFILLTTPLLPLVVISLFSIPIMYIASLLKNKSSVSSILSLVVIIAIMVGYFLLAPNFAYISELQSGLPQQVIEAFKTVSNVFYPNKVLMESVLDLSKGLNFLIFLAILLGSLALALFMSTLSYRKSLSRALETAPLKNKKQVAYVSQSAVAALISRDFKNILRFPGLALSSFIGVFMAPLLLLIFGLLPMISSYSQAETEQVLSSFGGIGFVYLYALIGIGTNYTALLAFSREGKTFSILKTLPIDGTIILKSKLYFANIQSAINILLIVIVQFIFYDISVWGIILSGIILFGFSVFINMYSILRDLKKPNLSWTNVNQIANKNYYVLLPFLLCIVAAIAIFVFSSLLGIYAKNLGVFAELIFYAVLGAATLGAYLGMRSKFYEKGRELYDALDGE